MATCTLDWDEYKQMIKQIETLESERDLYRKALEFYAKGKGIEIDGGWLANQALDETE